jgi:excisionase family DNA binding protein
MIPNPLQSPILTVAETAQLLGLGKEATYRAIQKGEIPSVRIGKKILVPTIQILNLLGIQSST